MLRSCEKLISREKNRFFHREISVSCNTTTVITALYYPISSLLSVIGRLREVKNKRKLQTFSSESGRVQEVPSVVIWPKNFWYFGKLVAEERWSQPEIRLYFQSVSKILNPTISAL